jgi:hypothetical protein
MRTSPIDFDCHRRDNYFSSTLRSRLISGSGTSEAGFGLASSVLGSALGSSVLGSALGSSVLGSSVAGSVVAGSVVAGSVVAGSSMAGSIALGSAGGAGGSGAGFAQPNVKMDSPNNIGKITSSFFITFSFLLATPSFRPYNKRGGQNYSWFKYKY